MRIKLTKEGLNARIYEEVQKVLSEGFEGSEDNKQTAFILQPQYTDFIKNACHILAWKGLNFNINIRGMEFKVAQKMVSTYLREKQAAMKSGNPKEAVASVKNKWRTKQGCEGLVDSEKKAFELFTGFKERGYDFISRILGSKTNASKQMEKEAGLALFGDEKGLEASTLSEFHIMNGAVFCVRDFYKWVEAGMPDFSRSKDGKLKRGDDVLKKVGVTGGIENKDELGNDRAEGEDSELWKEVKGLLDDYNTNAIDLAKAIVGGNISNGQDSFQEVMLYISEYKKLIKGSNQNSDAFRDQAYDALDKLVEKIKELHAEPIINQLATGGGLNEGRLPSETDNHDGERAELFENVRQMKLLAAKSYDLADVVGDRKIKDLVGKILMALIKISTKEQ